MKCVDLPCQAFGPFFKSDLKLGLLILRGQHVQAPVSLHGLGLGPLLAKSMNE
jgi:hypothetical protein